VLGASIGNGLLATEPGGLPAVKGRGRFSARRGFFGRASLPGSLRFQQATSRNHKSATAPWVAVSGEGFRRPDGADAAALADGFA